MVDYNIYIVDDNWDDSYINYTAVGKYTFKKQNNNKIGLVLPPFVYKFDLIPQTSYDNLFYHIPLKYADRGVGENNNNKKVGTCFTLSSARNALNINIDKSTLMLQCGVNGISSYKNIIANINNNNKINFESRIIDANITQSDSNVIMNVNDNYKIKMCDLNKYTDCVLDKNILNPDGNTVYVGVVNGIYFDPKFLFDMTGNTLLSRSQNAMIIAITKKNTRNWDTLFFVDTINGKKTINLEQFTILFNLGYLSYDSKIDSVNKSFNFGYNWSYNKVFFDFLVNPLLTHH